MVGQNGTANVRQLLIEIIWKNQSESVVFDTPQFTHTHQNMNRKQMEKILNRLVNNTADRSIHGT